MAASKIEWTDATWNPVYGCSKVSPGCAHCYAETMAARLRAMALADLAAGRDPGRKRYYLDVVDELGRWTGRLIPAPEALNDPLRWRKPRRVFVNSMSDLFHEELAREFIASVFSTMESTPRHTYQILTKRGERLRDLVAWIYSEWMGRAAPLPNVWLGVSVERQAEADDRIPWLLGTPAAVRFLSCEPLLGRIVLPPGLDWVIAGGESGRGARPCHRGWIRYLRDQCIEQGVAFFFKQWGEWEPLLQYNPPCVCVDDDGTISTEPINGGYCPMRRAGKHDAGRLLDGRTWDEYPKPQAEALV